MDGDSRMKKIILQTTCANCNGIVSVEYATNGIINIESIIELEFKCTCGCTSYYDCAKSVSMG